jgi:hypothetical protein
MHEGPSRGLHIGWIPNEPGRRPRDYPEAPPKAPEADPHAVRRAREGQHWSGMRRVLIAVGLLALVLFGGMGVIGHKALFYEVGAGIAVVFWLGALASSLSHRRAVAVLRKEQVLATQRHATALATHRQSAEKWNVAEAERVASAPRWLRVSSPGSAGRLDVFGGTSRGRRGMLAAIGGSLLERHAVIVLDLSQERVSEGLIAAARQAGISHEDYHLPRDLSRTPLLAGMTADQVASQIVEVLHADDPNATAASRATDLMVARKVIAALAGGGSAGAGRGANGGADEDTADGITMGRLSDALACLVAGSPQGRLAAEFPDGFRREVAGSLIRLAAVVEPLRDLGSDTRPRPPARLTCLSVEEGPRDVVNDLTAALVVQWATSAIVASASDAGSDGGEHDGGRPRPAVILAGADEQAARHLQRLTAVCERYDVPLIRTFSRLSAESARHLDTRDTAFMKLATRAEAVRAAEHIGLERKFVAGRLTQTRTISQSRTRTTGESFTHTTGSAQGEAITKSTGTTEGQSLSETVIKRRGDRAHDHAGRSDDNSNKRNVPGDSRQARGASGHAGGDDVGGGKARPERVPAGDRGRPGKASSGGEGKHQPYVLDFMTSRTKHKFTHQSEAKTESWTRTEESSHTQTQELSKTEGTSVGDEVTYELTYDHKVAPETLMDLPEDQMLAPHVVEGAAIPGVTDNADLPAGPAESKMIALVVNPEVIGSAPVAHVEPGQIPAFQPPPPLVAKEVPDSLKALRRGVS